jgi:hypothetical protein
MRYQEVPVREWLGAARPGFTSTIIGARRMAQLEDNIQALSLTLTRQQVGRLKSITTPTFGFPQKMEPMFPAIHHGGTRVNGMLGELSPFVIGKDDKPY